MKISTDDQYRLAIEARVHARTVRRWLDGGNVTRASLAQLEAAAKRLQLDVGPPEGGAKETG
uniref:Uncharacterized protein n=1 Tax=viral metagenome TaxID=1070528 RepID=A0A6H1ZA28_9ZZZZ